MNFSIRITKELPTEGIFVYRIYKDKFIVLHDFDVSPALLTNNVDYAEFNKGLTQLYTPVLNAIEKRVDEFLLRQYIKNKLL